MTGNNKEAFQKAMNQGHSAAWDQDWDNAAGYYSRALEELPDHPQALSSLGLAMFELHDYPLSLSCYQKASSISPDDPIPQEKIARIYERMGKLNEAIKASLRAAELHLKSRSAEKAIDNWLRVLIYQPDNISVRTRLAAVYEKLGRREEAVSEYIATASVFQRSGDSPRAVKAVEYALKIMPENPEVRLALSLARSNQPLPRPSKVQSGTGPVQMAQIREKEGDLGIPSEETPDPIAEARKKGLVQLAGMLFDQADEAAVNQNTSRSRNLYSITRGQSDQGNDSGDRNRIILHLSQAIESQTHGENSQTLVELEHALNLGLRQPAAYFILGLLIKETNPEKGLKYLQQSVKHPDYSLASHLLFAQIYENSNQWKEAATSYLQALAIADAQVVQPDEAEEILNQYDAIIDAQSSVEDRAAHQAACKAIASQLIRPNWQHYLLKTRQNMTTPSDGYGLSPIAEMVLETRDTHVVEAMELVRKLAARDQLRSALEEALFALQYAPAYLPLHVLIGDLLLQDGRITEAVKKYHIIVELYTVRGEASRAERLLKRVSQIMPTDVGVRQRLIELLTAQEKTEDALNENLALADLFYNLADLDKARQTYMDALKIAQRSKNNRAWGVNLLLKVADIDMQRLNLRQALRIFEQIRTIQPDHSLTRSQIVAINFRLGQDAAAMKELDEYISYLQSKSRSSQAIVFINDLLIDHAGKTDLRRRLADLYIRNNEISEAIIQLDAVADTLLTADKIMESINILETIVSLNPPNIQEYRAALESLRRGMLRK